MRISDWSSDVCSSDLGRGSRWRKTQKKERRMCGVLVPQSLRGGQRWVAALRAGLAAGAAVVAAAFRWASDLDRNAVTFVALSGVFPRTSMRPPCLRKAVRSAAMVSLVRLRPTSLALLGRADRCEVLLDLRGMESPCRWFTVAALALANGMRQLPG